MLSLPRATVVADRLRQAGADLGDPRDLSAAAHYRAVRAMHEEHPAGFDRRRSSNWEPYNRTYAQILGLTNERWSDVVGSTFRAGGLWTEPRCGAIRAAVRLFDARMPIAVVSNNDGTAVDQLNEIGEACGYARISTHFVHVVDSATAGFEKPNPAVFDGAILALKVD